MLMSVPRRKHTKGNEQNSGGREALESRDKGTRREALLGETRSSGTGGSHPGQES